MNCPKCNKKNDKTAVFCIYCGKELKVNEKVATEEVQSARTNRMALAGFIVSMVSFTTGILAIAGIVGIVLSAIGLSQIKKNGDKGRGFAIGGLVAGILAVGYMLLRILFIIIYGLSSIK